ncbi:Protein of unknown function [Pyronema omphalodes CBS 100304]|uniref:Uncharacterized protein n=1 Tax=Pyronema omphalodes (strain CBS 100304) TaxID=1076935 RepID=U4KY55_PYROM|nr:Protein of unknown function [Pyronema omphalodes CBS 100304]
MAGLSGTSMC